MNATTFDKESLLRFLFYHMTQEQREEVMRELPGCYNRYTGQPVALVVRSRNSMPV